MSAQTKVLIGVIATTAFVLGFVFNSGKIEATESASSLVNAELGKDDGVVSVRSQLQRLNLVNFWATWCAPCRHEMPVFESMYQAHNADGFQIIGIAIDNPERSQPFLDSMGITYPILYAERTGMELMETVGNPNGLLPYSLLLDSQGKVLDQKLGKIDEADILAWLAEYPN